MAPLGVEEVVDVARDFTSRSSGTGEGAVAPEITASCWIVRSVTPWYAHHAWILSTWTPNPTLAHWPCVLTLTCPSGSMLVPGQSVNRTVSRHDRVQERSLNSLMTTSTGTSGRAVWDLLEAGRRTSRPATVIADRARSP